MLKFSIFMVFLASCAHPHSRTLSEQYETAVGILNHCNEEPSGMGSGVLVGRGLILTAAHVIACPTGKASIQLVATRGGFRAVTRTKRVDVDRDVALLEIVEAPTEPPYVIPAVIATPPRLGEAVCAITAAPSQRRACGLIDIGALKDPSYLKSMSGVFEPGNSGSAVYDRFGRLVGVMLKTAVCGEGHHKTLCLGKFATLDPGWMEK